MSRTRSPLTGLVALVSALGVVSALAAGPGDYYDHNLDGSWVGWVRIATPQGKRLFPLQLNLNVEGESGVGTAFFAEGLGLAPVGFADAPLSALTVQGVKIALQFELDGGPAFDAALRYKPARDQLAGKMSVDGVKSPVKLYRVDRSTAVQRTWVGSWAEAPGSVVALSLPGTAGASRDTKIKGTAFVGEEYGTFRGSVADGRVVGKVKLTGPDLALDLLVGDSRLEGTGDRGAGPQTLELDSLGSAPKARLVKVLPPALEVGVRTTVRVVVRDLAAGSIVHFSFDRGGRGRATSRRGVARRAVNPVRILAVETVSAKEIRAEVIAPGDHVGGRLSVHVEAFDGPPLEKAGALRVGGERVSLVADVEPLLTSFCSECHRFGTPSLFTGSVHATTVNVRSTEIPMLDLIEPFEPDRSYLVWKIRGDPGIVGARMPFGLGPLTDEQISLVVRWVSQGALND